jgi:Flp pilus assembly protein TadD
MAVTVLGAAVSFYHWPQVDFRLKDGQPEGLGIRASAYPAGEYAMLAVASLEAGHPDVARSMAQEAAVLDPDWAYPHLVGGNAAAALGDWSAAALAYARALELEPAGPRAYVNLGVACERLGHYQLAVEVYEQGASGTLPDAGLLGNYAILLYRAGEREAAAAAARKAAILDAARPQVKAVLAALAGRPVGHGPIAEELSRPLDGLRFGAARPVSELLTAIRRVAEGGSGP